MSSQFGATLVVHGHHHQCIDYLAARLITDDLLFLVHGVDIGDFLAWPTGDAG